MSKRAALPRRASNDDGNVLLEFAFVAPVLIVLIINILDFSRLIWAQMEVEYSAQMGAQAAYKSCSTGTLPAKTNCASLSTAVTTAVQSTSLGSGCGPHLGLSDGDLLLHFRDELTVCRKLLRAPEPIRLLGCRKFGRKTG